MDHRSASHREGETIAAIFSDRRAAESATASLHDAGFRNVWLGVAHGDAGADGATVAPGGGVMRVLGRLFGGEGSHDQPLYESLVAHGVSETRARSIEANVGTESAVVTVETDDGAAAIERLRANGGNVIGDPALYDESAAAQTTNPLPDDDNDVHRLQLREERLAVDKERVTAGEAHVRKDVVSSEQTIDVPVYHEELVIERRPVGGLQSATTPIDGGVEIRIPLHAERVDVQKRTVVTEEVAIGKRRVMENEHVTGTVRREQLRVDNDAVDSQQRNVEPENR